MLKIYCEKCARCSGEGFFFLHSVCAVCVFSVPHVGKVCVPGEWMVAK